MSSERPITVERLKELATIAPNIGLNADSAAELRALASEVLLLRAELAHARRDLCRAAEAMEYERG